MHLLDAEVSDEARMLSMRLSAGKYGTAEKMDEDILKSTLRTIFPRERSKDNAYSVENIIVHMNKYTGEVTRIVEMESNP